jgi:organic radical activating enzyme
MIYKSPIKSNKIENNLIEKFRAEGVSVFGTGNFGALVKSALESLNIPLKNFIDNNDNNIGSRFKSIDVISAEMLSNTNSKNILIASLNFRYLKRQLKDLGYENFYDVDFLFDNFDLTKVDTKWSKDRCKVQLDLYNYSVEAARDKEKLKVNSLDLVLTEKCSLKCKDCSNLMQFYEKPIDNDLEVMLESFDNFMQAVDYCYEIRMIGGEPLMYKQIDKVLEKVLSSQKVGNIIIYTNGTIVPKGEKINIFKNPKIYFRISDYGQSSRNVSKLEEVLKENNIHYITERVTSWQDCAKIDNFKRDENLNKKIFGNCCVNETLTMLHGKLYLCPYSAHLENLKIIKPKQKEHVDLYKRNDFDNLTTEIRSLYFGKEYLEACNFCNGRDHNVATIPAAIQTKTVLPFKQFLKI